MSELNKSSFTVIVHVPMQNTLGSNNLHGYVHTSIVPVVDCNNESDT